MYVCVTMKKHGRACTVGQLTAIRTAHCYSFAHGMGVQWYIDHTMLLNATRRAQWLRWARSRQLDSVWVAPHATDVDLIEIPGVEGSHADDVSFCHFIHEADEAGVDVQLFASPMSLVGKGADEVDLRFALSCVRSMLQE
eukprot:COSAG01_NODE_9243_length_2507_cov_4.230482_5_plen_140_part_00